MSRFQFLQLLKNKLLFLSPQKKRFFLTGSTFSLFYWQLCCIFCSLTKVQFRNSIDVDLRFLKMARESQSLTIRTFLIFRDLFLSTKKKLLRRKTNFDNVSIKFLGFHNFFLFQDEKSGAHAKKSEFFHLKFRCCFVFWYENRSFFPHSRKFIHVFLSPKSRWVLKIIEHKGERKPGRKKLSDFISFLGAGHFSSARQGLREYFKRSPSLLQKMIHTDTKKILSAASHL